MKLCQDTFCYIRIHSATSRYVTLCIAIRDATQRQLTLHQDTFCYIRIRSATSRYVLLHQDTFHYITLCSATSRYVLLHCDMFRYIAIKVVILCQEPPINVIIKKTVINCLWVCGFEGQLFKKVLILKIENLSF